MPKPVYQKENLMLHCRKQKNTRRCTIKLVTTFSKQVFSYESRFCPSCRNIYNLKWAFRMSYKLFSSFHRPCVFTIRKNSACLNCLFRAARNVILCMFFNLLNAQTLSPAYLPSPYLRVKFKM